MAQIRFLVYFLVTAPLIFLGCSTMATHASQPEMPLSWPSKTFESHENWLALNLDEKPAELIRRHIDNQTASTESTSGQPPKTALKHRGEAHITILTPPEFNLLKDKLTMKEIEAIAQAQGLQISQWTPVCLGRGQHKNESTYYVVVQSQDLFMIRQAISREYIARAGRNNFAADHFYPHITIGFTDRDLHEADGVIKDKNSCGK